jgi:hypothetical protein
MSKFIRVGDYKVVAGSRKRDKLTGIGPQVVYGGGDNDRLTGFNTVIKNGQVIVPPILSGGSGDDRYDIRRGTFTVIADAGGGRDFVNAKSMDFRQIGFIRINQRDIYASDGNTAVLLIDPQGVQGRENKLERFNIGGRKMSLSKLTKIATRSGAFLGDFTYGQLERSGILDFKSVGLNPNRIESYIEAAIKNNSIIG